MKALLTVSVAVVLSTPVRGATALGREISEGRAELTANLIRERTR